MERPYEFCCLNQFHHGYESALMKLIPMTRLSSCPIDYSPLDVVSGILFRYKLKFDDILIQIALVTKSQMIE